MIERINTVVQMLTINQNLGNRVWVAAVARQTLIPVTATVCRGLAELGYDSNLGANYNSRFYGLSQMSRRPSVSFTWGFDPVRYRLQSSEVTWRHLFGLAPNSNHSVTSMFCQRNSSSSAVSWIEDPSTDLHDYFMNQQRRPDRETPLTTQYGTDLLPRVLEVLQCFGSICLIQASMYGSETRAIPDMSSLVNQLIPLLSAEDLNLLNSFMRTSAAVRLLCRSYVATLEAADVDGPTTASPVGDATVPTGQTTNRHVPISVTVGNIAEGTVSRSPRP